MLRLIVGNAEQQLSAIHAYLSQSYWAAGIPIETVRRSIDNSLCFGVLDRGLQVAFARVVTDKATFAYLADVYVLESHRGRGLARMMLEAIDGHPDLKGLRRFALVTRDAHGLYEKFGFKPLARPAGWMERRRDDAYVNPGNPAA